MASETQRPDSARSRWWVSALVALSVLAAVIATPVGLLAALFWAADGDWHFEGKGLRHWLFVKGKYIDRLGLVAPAGNRPRYSAFRRAIFRAGPLCDMTARPSRSPSSTPTPNDAARSD